MIGLALLVMAFADAESEAEVAVPPVRALIVTGGHDFERPQFFAMFDSMSGITWKEVVHPEANKQFTPEAAREYDVIVLYDMWQDITDEQKQQFVQRVKDDGKGLVALHHCLVSYQKWPEFRVMIGGQFTFDVVEIDGKKYGPNTFDHDQSFRVQIVDPADPVTKGMTDFDLVDETYGGYYVANDVKPLLKVDHPKSAPIIGWSKTYGKGRVVYLQSGHDHTSFDHKDFRALVRNALLWTAAKSEK
ncbi:MAG: ThuA domain-containing protein [Candidatus Hydrogenedentes bacterium]|nr:ThuA domain-containing protein [Candidatus Hydrogenedentota bacterium]